jgi:hypothetical protein
MGVAVAEDDADMDDPDVDGDEAVDLVVDALFAPGLLNA